MVMSSLTVSKKVLRARSLSLKGWGGFQVLLLWKGVSCSLSVEVVLFSSKKSGIVIRFDNHMMSRHGGHFKIREFSYSLRLVRHLFDYTRVIYL